MKKTIILSLLLVVLSSLTIFGQIGSNAISIIETDSNYVKGEILIKFKSIPSNKKAVVAAKQQLISKYKSKVVKQWRTGAEHWKVDTLLPGYNLIKIIDSLNTNPYVEYAEPNYILRADIIPNDPSFGDQWALNNTGQNDGTPDADIDAPESWDITTGDTNIVVGVIDSGIDYEHEDLEDNIWTNWDEIPDNGIDDDNNGYIDDIHGWDFYNNDDDPMDDFGHGTHVAGTIGAVSNNGIGVTGVAWDVRMMALKFLGSDGSGPTSGAVSAIIYGTANGVKLTNNSWGGGEYSQTLYDAIASADTAGILFIASAGNDAKDNDANPTYPSCYDLENIISIASTDRNDSLSTFSNWGLSTVDIAAPGSSILSTEPNNQYGYKSGTSMAAPNVSGGIVLAWAQFPGFSSHQIIHQILGGSDQKENLDGLMNSGSRLNIYNAVVDTNISIKVNHREIEFGALLLGNQSEENEILISNMQDDQILIDSIICDTGFLITRNSTFTNFIPSFSINPNQVDTITVVFNPTIEGYFNKTCKIYYSTSGLISRTVTVFLSGYCAGNGTIINAGTVSGIWEKALSPYIINGNISIEASNTLSIEPGVNVLFAGYYKVVVSDNSTLIANGSENDSIYFQAIDPVEGWAGMDLISKQNMDSLSYCVFKNGKAQNIIDQSWPPNYNGGVISITHSSPFISDCSFKNNNAPVGFGGAIYIYGNSYPVLTQLEFFNNTAPYGGAIAICGTSFDETYRILNNIVFIDNTAAYGGALYNQQGNLIINNLTFYSNNAYYGGGAICLWSDSDVLLKNSILYGNTSPDGSEIKFGSYMVPSSLFIEYCNIDTTNSDWYSHDSTYSDLDVFQMGDGNIYSNPLFVNINNNNLSISTNSPCIDAGNPNDNVAEEPFPNGYRINMGFNGGTINATGTTDPGLANIPNPLDFEILSPNETKQLPLFVKNGSPITIHISDISLSDTSNFKISTNYIIPDTLSSGQVDSVMIDFTSSINVDSLYQISITINTIETPDYIIPAEANILIGTNVISNNVSGIWTEEGSPYNIFNDISVETNDSLKIEPGVTVRFMGKYNFRIAESSRLLAQGTQALPIYFTAFDTINGWYGIDIVNSGNDDIFEYCNMSRGNVNGTSPNDRGGALFISNSDPLIKHSIIEHNAGNYAAAVYLFYSEAEFNDVIIRNNTCSDMGVIEILFSENVLFENCTIYNNYSDAQGGAFGIFQNSDINILNSLIFNNTGTTYGGGISIQSSSCSLINVSMVNNLTGYRGNEIHLMNGSHVDIINSIIYNNCNNINPASGELFNDIYLDSYSNPTQNTLNISYSNIDTLKSNWVGSQAPINGLITWGDGNTTLNPQFTDINNWNFKLDSISPCIDAGINDSIFSSTDLDGKLRIWDGNGNDTATVDMGAYEYGAPPAQFQEIDLLQGWNIFSANVAPVDDNMISTLNSIIDSSQLIKAVDEAGGIVQNIPGVGWLNTIGNMENTEGYYIKTTENTNLSIVGAEILLPYEIPLQTGWNIMGYPVSSSQDAITVFNQLITPDSTLIKVINESGGFIQYIPGYGWMNTIDSLAPGEGYYIKVNANDTLILSEPSKAYTPTQKPKIAKPVYFLSNNLNPYNPMNFVITKIVGEGFEVEDDDEIAVYDGNIKVGSAVIIPNYKGLQVITAKANDPLTEIIDGFCEENNITFKYWDKSNNRIYDNILVYYSSGNSSFTNLGTFIGELKIFTTEIQEIEIPETTYLGQNYPNPFSNETTIEYGIANKGKILLSIYDISGRKLKTLINKHQTQGNYSVTFYRSTFKPGVYYYEIIVSNDGVIFSDVKKMIIK